MDFAPIPQTLTSIRTPVFIDYARGYVLWSSELLEGPDSLYIEINQKSQYAVIDDKVHVVDIEQQ